MVEVGGIEPPSESLLTSFSPSAATILGFPSPVASRRAAGYGSFMITDDAAMFWRARSPHTSRREPGLWAARADARH